MSALTTMILAPNAVQQFFDNNGHLLVGGKLFTYEAGSVVKQDVYTDSAGGNPLPNPIVLNARGEVAPSAMGSSCGLWMNPTLAYKFVLAPADDSDPPTNAIWTVDDIVSPQAAILAALAAYEATLAGVPIGCIMPFTGTSVPTGWLLCYGQAISRTTYAALFAVIGISYGPGDSSTTFNLPDLRGRYPLGKDNMGGSAMNRVTQAVSGILATTLGSAGGDQHAQEDTLTSTSTATSVVDEGSGHSHTIKLQGDGGGAADGQPTSIAGGDSEDGSTEIAFTGISVTTTVTTTTSGTSEGASQNMPPCQVTNYIIFASV
jgi:microcystin-dependent protein